MVFRCIPRWKCYGAWMRVVVAGSPFWSTWDDVKDAFKEHLWENVCLLAHGGGRGIARIADTIAKERRWSVREYRMDRKKHGSEAGRWRNLEMLEEVSPDLVLVFNLHGITCMDSFHCMSAAEALRRRPRVVEISRQATSNETDLYRRATEGNHHTWEMGKREQKRRELLGRRGG